MIKAYMRKATLLLTSLIAGFMLMAPATALAQSKNEVCQGIGLATGSTGCATPAGTPSVNSTVKSAINILSFIVGVISVVMVIIGGLKFITSSGDAANVSSARNTIIYAVVGLVVVALAQVIVRFVLDKVT